VFDSTRLSNFLPLAFAFLLAPLLLGLINRTKAILGGRCGPPILQTYYDLRKLLGKGAVYSRTTSWVFRAGPIVTLAATAAAALLVPFGPCDAPVHFVGDLVLFAYLLGLARFFTVAAALDTGSPFEGMGASREVFFSALAEPALLLGLVAVAKAAVGKSGWFELTGMHQHLSGALWLDAGLVLLFVAVALFLVLLAECSRIPVDDPNTHLELTMIHEVMVLDHSGPDFAYILYGSALKLWLLSALVVSVVVPRVSQPWLDLSLSLASVLALAVVVGLVESGMARLRLVRVPQLLVGAAVLAVLALVLESHT
jgi:formate hydrogenlyase subunit 4